MNQNGTKTALLNMADAKIDPTWALRVPSNLALRRKVLPFCRLNGRVLVACRDKDDTQALQAVERYLELPIEPIVAEVNSLDAAIKRIFGGKLGSRLGAGAGMRSAFANAKAAVEPEADDLIAICDELLHAAIIRGASDLHISPGPDDVRIRLRVDGQLEDYRRLAKVVQNALISRIKVLCGMDIAERRAPQDGRITMEIGDGEDVDLRVASIPTRFGERLTIRFLSSKTGDLTLERLGMLPDDLATFSRAIDKPHGLILLTGPTGSGKSTTLYAAIRRLMERRSLNVITIEDPIEYEIAGVDQVEVDAVDKVSFSKALRSALRHDPDVLMIGEIRDAETANIAIKAALTGHLVFSTLHTNSAANAVTRLVDMGVEPYLVGATLRLSVAQRLVRRSCKKCLQEQPLSVVEARILGSAENAGSPVFVPQGCMYCGGRGIVGQLGLFEMMSVDAEISRAISSSASEAELVEIATRKGTRSLVDDAMAKTLQGLTTAEAAMAVVSVW